MSLENLTGPNVFIDDLVRANPDNLDDAEQGADHLRGIKNVLLNTFPNVTGAVTLTQQELNGLVGGKAGELFDFAGTVAPLGSLACPTVQTNISRVTYAALFAAIGTTWGAGDGSTTFGMPWFPVDYAAIQSSGNVSTQSTGVVKDHTHPTWWTQVIGGSQPGYTASSNYGNSLTATTGSASASGAANLAAGVRVLKCVRI